jgi:hypothetical protein
MLITERRRRGPRRGFMLQAQAAQQRLNHAPVPYAPPSYGQVPSSSKEHRREGYLASVQMKLVILTLFFCSSAECSSPATAASRRHRQRPGHRPAWAPRSRTFEHADNGALALKATPRINAAGTVDATTAKRCALRRQAMAKSRTLRRYIAARGTLPLCE